MSRARAGKNESIFDAARLASSGATLEREFTLAELARLAAAGAGAATRIQAVLSFFEYERCAAVRGSLTGIVVLECQRCLGAYEMPLDEQFELVLVANEDKAPAVSPAQDLVVIEEVERLDLRWLIDEQVLLALPLVASHEHCHELVPGHGTELGSESVTVQNDTAVAEPLASAEPVSAQRPFANLSDLLQRKR